MVVGVEVDWLLAVFFFVIRNFRSVRKDRDREFGGFEG